MTADLGGSVVSAWTPASTGVSTLSTDPVSILISGSLDVRTNVCAFDEFELVEDSGGFAISVKPTDAWYLSGTSTITAIPNSGVLPYTKVEFDVNADSSIEFTDTAAPWEYVWDTTSDVSIGTSGTVSLKVIATKLIFQEFIGVFNMLERLPLSTLFAKLLFSSSRLPFFS